MASKDSEKIDLIYDLVRDNRQELNDFRKEVKEDTDFSKEKLATIEYHSGIQNQHLAEHIRRTNILEDLHKDNLTRIEKLEEPRIVLSVLKKWFIGIGTIAGAVAAIMKLLGII
jgi:hypothetical protein